MVAVKTYTLTKIAELTDIKGSGGLNSFLLYYFVAHELAESWTRKLRADDLRIRWL